MLHALCGVRRTYKSARTPPSQYTIVTGNELHKPHKVPVYNGRKAIIGRTKLQSVLKIADHLLRKQAVVSITDEQSEVASSIFGELASIYLKRKARYERKKLI
ncbi:hypothetical protein WN51_12961 [Melipona quadrifasciata]|uniref:Uncharacterized protein n=1 Tax=Melipona quadrifasciata TaxID=166423 RepID=A0A0N0U7R2_9HYME|nr:hypothetical protein WN51_12961 [Melipona quadrifasciata]